MRLLQHTNRTYLVFMAAMLFVVGATLYIVITRVISDEVSEKLTVDRERIVRELQAGRAVNDLAPVIEIDTLPTQAAEEAVHAGDVSLIDPMEKDEETFREVRGSQRINGVHYRITARAVVLEPHDYLFSIGLSLLIGSLLVLAGLLWVNRFLARAIWGGFHRNLDALQHFDLRKDDALALEPSRITEFAALNGELARLTERIRNDHRVLKEFTGNASHEMQTPLAALQARLEGLLGQAGLDAAMAAGLQEAHAQSLRLSRLHHGLLLLSRIENRQFRDTSMLVLADAVEQALAQYAERIAVNGIAVEKALDRSVTVAAHPALLEALLANVIGNAIKHQRGNGPVKVVLTGRTLEVSNSGEPLPAPAEDFFQRFRKGDPTSASPGLGLSIARCICDTYGWQIAYDEHAGTHVITILL